MRESKKLLLALLVSMVFPIGLTRAATGDPSLETGRKFAPFALSLRPSLQMSPLPGWMPGPAVVRPETATIEIPVPALWSVPSVDLYALTVVFEDLGDGGPAVEWRSPNGSTTTVSQGLGELGVSLGLNARTTLLPKALTRDGGVLLISYYAKFDGLVSLAVRPAREDPLAVLGGQNDPALVDEALRVFERSEVDGQRKNPLSGDIRRGAIVEAELSAPVQELDGSLEFIVPVDGSIEGAILKLDTLGLDPEATLQVQLNSVTIGQLGFPPFRLDDPTLVPDSLGRLVLAGWRTGSVFIPARLWLPGENSVVVTLKRSESETVRPLFIRNTGLHLRFGTPSEQGARPFEEPDLTIPDPLVPDPGDAPLPEIVTGVQ
ncbi:MAG: hypothetical protein ACOYM3_23075 [Terrimicrobiaceae bacterium]